MLNKNLFSVLILLTIQSYSQNITGTIKDIKNKKPIPYATIQVRNNYGTITNEEGEYNLNSKNFKKKDSLKITYIGYKTKIIALNDLPKTIYLEEDIIDLEEINLDQKKYTAIEIIEKTTDRLKDNYDNLKLVKQQLFIRNKSINKLEKFKMKIERTKNYNKKTIKEINRVIDSIRKPILENTSVEYIDEYLSIYHKNKDSVRIKMIKATKLSNPDADVSMEGIQKKLKEGFKTIFKSKTFKVKVIFFKVEDSINMKKIEKDSKESVLYPKDELTKIKSLYKSLLYKDNQIFKEILNPKKYTYKITNNLFYNDEFVYEITYTPKHSSSNYKGKIYISDDTFAILKLDFNMLEGKKLQGMNLKWLGMKYKVYDWNGIIEYYQASNGKYVPKYLKQSKKMYSYVKIPVKFIENSNEKNKLKFKLKSEFESILTQQSEILFIENTTLKTTEYKDIKLNKKFPLDNLKYYNSDIWRKYNIIAPTKSQVEFSTK